MRKLPAAAAGVLLVLVAACDPTAPASPGKARKAAGSATTGASAGTSGTQPAGGDPATAADDQAEPVSPADARARDAQRHARDRGERQQ